MSLQILLTQVLYYSDTSCNKSVTGTIAEPGGGATGTEIKVIDSADGAPATVTFTATVAADTLTVGTSSKAGAALFARSRNRTND